jgi:hypothetical protein
MPDLHDPRQNHLLAALPAADYARLFPLLEIAEMPLGHVLYESGSQLRNVYFPTDSIVSLLYVMENGASAEIAVVGNDGIIGVALFMGGETMPNRAVVQSGGYAYRLKGQLLKDEFNRSGALQHLLADTGQIDQHFRFETRRPFRQSNRPPFPSGVASVLPVD